MHTALDIQHCIPQQQIRSEGQLNILQNEQASLINADNGFVL